MRSLLTALLILLPVVAAADPQPIEVQQVWSRAMPAGGNGVVYMTITARGAPDALTDAASPVAARAELHETVSDNGVMKMRRVRTLMLEPGQSVTLKPGGYHLMLLGLKEPLVAGTSFPVTLTFASGARVVATATVAKAGAPVAPMEHGAAGGMPMHDMPMEHDSAGGMPMRDMPMGSGDAK